jgi:hypothetical protein
MITLQSETRKSKESTVSGHLVSCDKDGVTMQTKEVAEMLLSEKYAFMGFAQIDGDEIKKVFEPEPLEIEKGEPIKTPSVNPTTPEEEIKKLEEEEELFEEQSFEGMLEGIDKIDELKDIAKALGLPKSEWEGYKRKDYFKNYLIEAVKED